ncbi:MAG: conjugal transfer protein TraX [Rickettsiales bacterium]|nr:conjugal transfer protein TraX [Rickettsiales bacterium]
MGKYGDVNRYDLLKATAFFIMVIDHLGLYIFTDTFALRAIGRASMPIFAILYGYSYKKPNCQILICGIIMSAMSAYFNYHVIPINILYTLYISGFFLKNIEKRYEAQKKLSIIFYTIMLCLLVLPSAMFIEYGLMILCYMFAAVLIKKEDKCFYDKIMLFIIYISTFVFMCLELFFRLGYCILAASYLALLFLYLDKKRNSLFSAIKIKNKIARNTILFCSRYSLYLYVIHITIYMLIARYAFSK